MKLNKESVSEEVSYREFAISATLYEMGIKCPKVLNFVTDGRRYGMTVERIIGKKSFTRLMADDPDLLEPLARDFAQLSMEFHGIECDISKFESKAERCRRQFATCPNLPDDVKEMLYGCLDSLDKVALPVHGDLSPGNIIRSESGDYWIDLGGFTYGDPDFDLACLVFVARYTPEKVLKYLFHLSRKQFQQFLEIYGQEYYGEKWHTPEMDEKIHNVVMIRTALAIVNNPRAKKLFLPLLRGQRRRFAIILRIADVLIPEFN